jgi:hypothetical protein
VADIAVVVDEGPVQRLDSNLRQLVKAARKATDSLSVVVTATGSLEASGNVVPASGVEKDVEDTIAADGEVVAAAAPGGLYLDQGTLADEKISDDDVIDSLGAVRTEDGGRLMEQVFPALAVSFARYC